MKVKKAGGDVRERIEETLALSQYLADVARGVAEAQHTLDQHSIRTAEEMAAKGLTLHWGITAGWFRIPEVDIELKLALDLRSASVDEDSPRLVGASGNAMYQNTYAFSVNAMSTLKARIVAVPQVESALPEQEQMTQAYIKTVQEGLKALNFYEGDINGKPDDPPTKQAIEDFKTTLRQRYTEARDWMSLARVDVYSPVDINPFVYEKLQEELQKQGT